MQGNSSRAQVETRPDGRGGGIPPARPCAVMGILNVTPDSFSDGGSYDRAEVAIGQARAIAAAGAAILDVGGESTRPGSDEVPVAEELARVLPVLDGLAGSYPLPISIDTRRAEVAAAAADRGATILNDTASLRDDPELAAVAAERGMTVVLMHRRGTPATMQRGIDDGPPPYADVVDEVRAFLEERVAFAVEAGIPRERLVLDPGIGFGKRFEDNDRLLAELGRLRLPGVPLLVGASRKAFLGRFAAAGGGDPEDSAARLPGSLAVAAVCARAGVEILRVHDVAETVALLEALAAFGVEPVGGEGATWT
jgi:dihydropteroate synthase